VLSVKGPLIKLVFVIPERWTVAEA